MAGSTLNRTGESMASIPQGHDTGALGPSDSSDSGSDTLHATRQAGDADGELDQHALEQGPAELESDSDRSGTGERASADGDSNLKPDGDILPDDFTDEPDLDTLEADDDLDAAD